MTHARKCTLPRPFVRVLSRRPAPRILIAALGLIGLSLLGGCSGGGNTALTTVPTAHLAVTLPAATVAASTPFTFTVTALDAANAAVPTYIGTVHITTSDPSAVLPPDATLARGVGKFTVTFSTTGSQTITASDTVGDASTGTSLAVSVKPIPVPTIASLSPTKADAGSAGFTLIVNGANFVLHSVAQWNGSNRSTVFVSSSQVTAQISAADIATDGTAAVTVFNPAPGGGSSNTSTFTVAVATVTGGSCTGLPRSPVSIAVDPTGQFAYVAEFDCTTAFAGHVLMYAINRTTGTLTSLGPPVPTNDKYAISVAVDPAGKFAYVANYGGSTASVSTYTINPSTGMLTSTGKTALGASPWWITIDPSGRFAYLANSLANDISMYTIDPHSGGLASIGPPVQETGPLQTPEDGPHSVTVDPLGGFAYVAIRGDGGDLSSGSVSVYRINSTTGALTFSSRVEGSCGAPVSLCGPLQVAIDRSDKFAVAVGEFGGVSMYAINATTGALTSLETISARTRPNSVAFDPTGNFVYVTNFGSNDVSQYSMDSSTMTLRSTGRVAAGSLPTSIAIDPSGRFAYVTNAGSNSVSMYSLDGATGTLTLIGTIGT